MFEVPKYRIFKAYPIKHHKTSKHPSRCFKKRNERHGETSPLPHCINCQLLASCIQLLLKPSVATGNLPAKAAKARAKAYVPILFGAPQRPVGCFSRIILQVGLDIDDDSPCSYFHYLPYRGFHRHGANPQMDGWRIPSQTWMITGGTHGYPYDLENPHHLPYIFP